LESPYLVFNHKMYFAGTKIKVCSASIKTLLMNSEKQIFDIPAELLANLK
jgi:hypothetical protein